MKSLWYKFVIALLSCGLFGLSGSYSYAETLNVTVTDSSGKPVKEATVSAYAKGTQNTLPIISKKPVIVDQVDKEFISHVTVVQTGTTVSFPNHDQIRHHVYSFSPAKTFEIPLYKGIPTESIVFEQEGVVALGCNIHDWMSAYIRVVDSPYFAVTDKRGLATITLPDGEYELRYWHPESEQQPSDSTQLFTMSVGQSTSVVVEMSIKPTVSSRRARLSTFNRGRYR